MTEIATQEQPTQLVTYSVTDARIAELAEEYKEVPKDLTVKANYKLVKSAAATCRGLRGDVERRRKELKADALEYGRKVDSAAKDITERLFAIEEPFATAKRDFDTAAEIAKREAVLAEERRVDGIADRIAGIKALVEANISSSSVWIQKVIGCIANKEMPCDWAEEFQEKADQVIRDTMEKLDEIRIMKLTQEQQAAQQAEYEAKRKADEELARVKREEEVAAERVKIEKERAEMAAKQAVIDAERKKEQDAMAAERAEMAAERAKHEELKAEIVKAEEPVKENPETAGQPELLSDYLAAGDAIALVFGSPARVKAVLDAIINGDIPHVKFTGEV